MSKQIRDVIEPVIIRRNRLDLQNNPYYKNEVKDLSKVEPPIEWFFELTKEQSVFYDKYKAFEFEKYLKSGSGRAFAKKRLCSID